MKRMCRADFTALSFGLGLFLVAPGFFADCRAQTEKGMGLVACETSGYGDWPSGQIRRIDVKNSVVINTTAPLGAGIGHHMRFNPRGDQYAYLVGDGVSSDTQNTVRICTLDGGSIRSFKAPNTGGAGYISWTNSGIWVSGYCSLTLYDTLGRRIRDYGGEGLVSGYRIYVSQNDTRGACVDENSWSPWIFNMISGKAVHLTPPTGATEGGCSVCPSPDGTMITNNLVDNSVSGTMVLGHKTMRIVDTLGKQMYYFFISEATKFPDNGYRWNTQAWSGNSNDWIIIPVGQDDGTVVPSADLSACIYNIRTKEKICLADNSGKSQWWMIYDYYSGKVPGSTTPSVQLSPAALSFAADSGAANPTTQTITASTANGTLQGLTVSGAKSWLTVTAGATSGASIAITNAPKIAGLAPNAYLDTITVNTANASSATYVVTLIVRRPAATSVLTTLSVTPMQYTIAPGATVNFLATCKNQSGGYFTGATIIWTVSGGGAIDQTGKFIAATAPLHGPHLIIATAAAGTVTLRDTSRIMVMRSRLASVYKRIDCGANSLLPAGWESDDACVSGGSDGANLPSVSTAGVAAAAPAAVYQSFRRGNPHSYRIPRLPQGPYTVRLHFVDWKDTIRAMSYSILGVNVLNDFRIVPLAGAVNKALALDFSGMITDTNGLSISCASQSGDEFEAGFEVMENRLSALCLLSPLGGGAAQFRVGQTIPVTWNSDTTQTNELFVKLSVNGGRSYEQVAPKITRADNTASWGTFNFTIPDSIGPAGGRVSAISSTCRMRVEAYFSPDPNNPICDMSDSNFAIIAGAGIRGSASSAEKAPRCAFANSRLIVSTASEYQYRIEVYALSGVLLIVYEGAGDRQFALPRRSGEGAWLVRMKNQAGSNLAKVVCIGTR